MNRIFRFKMAVRTGLIITLLLAVVMAAGCPKKQDNASAPASSDKKSSSAEANGLGAAISPTKPADTKMAMQQKVPSPSQLKAPLMPQPADLKPLESLKSAEEKIDFITEYADEHPESAAVMVYNVLDDNDVEVRTAAMELLAMEESNDPNVVYVAAKALKDSEVQIRQSALEACASVTDPMVGSVLVSALADQSEDVRTAAIQVADQKEPAIRLSVLKAGITSHYEDVREGAVSSLIDVSSPAGVDILIEGLKNPNPEFREPFKDALDFLLPIEEELETYSQYKKWWNANRNKFDDELTEKD